MAIRDRRVLGALARVEAVAVMVANRGRAGMWGAVTALALLACVSDASAAAPRRRPILSSIDAFTPAAADPRRSAVLSVNGLSDSTFRFTPSGTTGKRRRVTVAVRARVATPAASRVAALANAAPPTLSALAPAAYSLGASIGWKRFALSGDVSRVQGNLLPVDREGVDLGVSFLGRRFATRLQLNAERAAGDRPQLLGMDRSYSVDLGGSYAIARNLEVSGGVRYKTQRDRLDLISDERRDSQSVYVGTAFRF